MRKYKIDCTEAQARLAFKLGAPLVKYNCYKQRYVNPCGIGREGYLTPTAEEMIGWLDEKGVLVQIYHEIDWLFSINHFEGIGRFTSRKEAVLAGIDAALDFLKERKHL